RCGDYGKKSRFSIKVERVKIDMGTASCTDLSLAVHHPAKAGEFTKSHRAPDVKLLRGDPKLPAQTELKAIGETRRGIPINDSGVHGFLEEPRSLRVLRNDGLRVARAMLFDMKKRLLEAVNDPTVDHV